MIARYSMWQYWPPFNSMLRIRVWTRRSPKRRWPHHFARRSIWFKRMP